MRICRVVGHEVVRLLVSGVAGAFPCSCGFVRSGASVFLAVSGGSGVARP